MIPENVLQDRALTITEVNLTKTEWDANCVIQYGRYLKVKIDLTFSIPDLKEALGKEVRGWRFYLAERPERTRKTSVDPLLV